MDSGDKCNFKGKLKKDIDKHVWCFETCWHGKLSKEEAEDRLIAANKTEAYLFRESDIKSRRFLLSYISDHRQLFKHVFVPTASARKRYSSVSEAVGVMEKMILSSDQCRNPVSPLQFGLDEKKDSDETRSDVDDCPASDLACHACGIVCGDKERLRVHHQSHLVIECDSCLMFIGKNSYHAHTRKCKSLPRKVYSCDECDYKTCWPKCLRDHKKRVHEMGGLLCDICRKVFDTQENLIRHREIHAADAFTCPDCPKTFKLLKSRNRHQRLHHSRMIKTESGLIKLDTGHDKPMLKKKAGFDCTEQRCDRHFKDRRGLYRHITRAHVSSSLLKRKIYQCDDCPYFSLDASTFRRHLQTCDKRIVHVVMT